MKKYFCISFTILILSVFIYLFFFEIEYIPIIELDDSYNAKCLDGSNYRFNFIQGKGEGKNKFFFYLEGGGWCGQETLGDNFIESCFERANTSLGSKIGFFSSLVISRLVRLLSSKEKYNPNFYNWNKIFVRYCDGSSFISDRTYENNGSKIYMYGKNNLLGVLNYLKLNNNFTEADSVILSGFSAGSFATLIYANYIDTLTNKKNNTYIISDSGFFYDLDEKILKINKLVKSAYEYSTNHTEIVNLFNYYCDKKYIDKEPWKCLSGEYFIYNIKVPILSFQNLYDSWITRVINGNDCWYNKNFINNCSKEQLEKIYKEGNLLIEKIHNYPRYDHITLFYFRKLGHMLTYYNWIWDDKNFSIDGFTINDIIKEWYENVSNGKETEKREFIEKDNTHIESKDFYFYYSTLS